MKNKIKKLKNIEVEIQKVEKKIELATKKLEEEKNKLEEKFNKLENKLENIVKEQNKELIEKIEASDEHNYTFIDLKSDSDEITVHEDDGTLHINFGKIRGCFIGNQDINKSEWNKLAKKVLSELNLKNFKI